MNAINFIKTI